MILGNVRSRGSEPHPPQPGILAARAGTARSPVCRDGEHREQGCPSPGISACLALSNKCIKQLHCINHAGGALCLGGSEQCCCRATAGAQPLSQLGRGSPGVRCADFAPLQPRGRRWHRGALLTPGRKGAPQFAEGATAEGREGGDRTRRLLIPPWASCPWKAPWDGAGGTGRPR